MSRSLSNKRADLAMYSPEEPVTRQIKQIKGSKYSLQQLWPSRLKKSDLKTNLLHKLRTRLPNHFRLN